MRKIPLRNARTATIIATALVILLLLPVAGELWAPARTSEMMGGRMMVWGFLWAFLVFLAIVVLVVLVGMIIWQRPHRQRLK
jgi:uncharacterized membrane protein